MCLGDKNAAQGNRVTCHLNRNKQVLLHIFLNEIVLDSNRVACVEDTNVTHLQRCLYKIKDKRNITLKCSSSVQALKLVKSLIRIHINIWRFRAGSIGFFINGIN